MSLLTICQDAANEIGFSAPSSVIGNTDTTVVRILSLANRTGKTLAKSNWHELIKTHSFSTSASEPQYNLPSDYRAMVGNTAWNQTQNKPIFMITPQRWSYEKSANVTTFDDRFRLLGDDAGPDIGKRFTIHPTPDSVETIYYQYYSENWLTDTTGTTEYTKFQADADEVIFDEELFSMGVIWRLLKSIGQPYAEERAEYDRLFEIAMATSGAMEQLHADGNISALSNIPETGFG